MEGVSRSVQPVKQEGVRATSTSGTIKRQR